MGVNKSEWSLIEVLPKNSIIQNWEILGLDHINAKKKGRSQKQYYKVQCTNCGAIFVKSRANILYHKNSKVGCSNCLQYSYMGEQLELKQVEKWSKDQIKKYQIIPNGVHFGEFTILSYDKTKQRYQVQRDCNHLTTVTRHYLLSSRYGYCKDCGKEYKQTKTNEWAILNDGVVKVKLNNSSLSFYIDLQDWEKLKQYAWGICNGRAFNNKMGMLHKLIIKNPKNKQVDHKNRNILDNRRENLRLCTPRENARNKGLRPENSSGISGVSWMKSRNKWRAYITPNKTQVHLGYYTDFTEAILARRRAERKYYGEYTPQWDDEYDKILDEENKK